MSKTIGTGQTIYESLSSEGNLSRHPWSSLPEDGKEAYARGEQVIIDAIIDGTINMHQRGKLSYNAMMTPRFLIAYPWDHMVPKGEYAKAEQAVIDAYHASKGKTPITHKKIMEAINTNLTGDLRVDEVEYAAHEIGRMVIDATRQTLFGYVVREKGTDGPWHLIYHPKSIEQIDGGFSAFSDEEHWEVKPVYQ